MDMYILISNKIYDVYTIIFSTLQKRILRLTEIMKGVWT